MPHAAEGPRGRLFNGLPRKLGGGVKTPPYGLTFTGALEGGGVPDAPRVYGKRAFTGAL